MNKKTIGILVCMLLIASAVLPAVGIKNDYKTTNEIDSLLQDRSTIETEPQGLREEDYDWQVSGGNVLTGHGGSYPSGNVGIGTNYPLAKFHIYNGAVLFNGTTGATPASGAGTRLMWIPAKNAFRAGYVSDGQWNDSNIGSYSVAIGRDTTASGDYGSTALGFDTTASQHSSTAMGWSTTASGKYSTSMGWLTTASGRYSTALGGDTFASGDYGSIAMGSETTASGDYGSIAMGSETTASGTSSTAMGVYTTASGDYSTSMGLSTIASGGTSTAIGYNTIANGELSTSIGSKITVDGDSSVGIGLDHTDYTVTPNNVMSIMGGNVGIGSTAPNYLLDVSGGSDIVAQFSGRVKGGQAVNDSEFVTKGQVKSVVTTHYTPAGTSDTSGTVGDTAWDDNYFYVKTPNGWKRAELETWESTPLQTHTTLNTK